MGTMVKKQKDIAEGLNNYCVNVGPKLAKAIKNHDNSNITHYLANNNPKTMFLKDVTENEITDIVKNCKNKQSTGNDNIDMSINKKVIPHTVKPLIHIYNNPLKMVYFQIA